MANLASVKAPTAWLKLIVLVMVAKALAFG